VGRPVVLHVLYPVFAVREQRLQHVEHEDGLTGLLRAACDCQLAVSFKQSGKRRIVGRAKSVERHVFLPFLAGAAIVGPTTGAEQDARSKRDRDFCSARAKGADGVTPQENPTGTSVRPSEKDTARRFEE
jgi:hypothetical protein